MAERKEEEGWASKLKEYNSRHGRDGDSKSPLEEAGDSNEDRNLMEAFYVKFKGTTTNKYSVLPKFYSKVNCMPSSSYSGTSDLPIRDILVP